MAIDLEQLEMRTGDVRIAFNLNGSASATMAWECFHGILGDILYSGSVSRTVPSIGGLEAIGDDLLAEARSQYIGYVERHREIPAILDYSAHDAALILDDWMFYQDNGVYTLTHPVCGSYTGVAVDTTSFVSMVRAILGKVLPPPVWFWADSPAPGQVRVRCVAVAGAQLYAVLDGDTLLGTVPDATWRTLTVPAGSYNLRVCAVVGGKAGVPSFYIPVEVEAVAVAPLMTASEALADVEPLTPWQRFLEYMRK